MLALFLSMVCAAAPSPACMNDYVPNVAAIQRSRTVLEQLRKHVVKEPWEARRDRLRTDLANGGDYRVKNDLATSLAHTGQAAEAVTLLEQIEAEKPGLYVTAANLGTAYELAGNDEKALEWIRQGIERNARAHEGTEWLHVRILQAKLALKDDPRWLESNSVLGPRKGTGQVEFSVVGNRDEALSTEQIKAALIYQLHERLRFVNPPDAIVGSLLLDLGELITHEPSGSGGAYDVYKLAYSYLDKLPNVESLQMEADLGAMSADMFGQRLYRQSHSFERGWKSGIVLLAALGALLSVLVIRVKRRFERKLAGTSGPGTS
jgi:hypothetical protein